jgi:hypothetical protein
LGPGEKRVVAVFQDESSFHVNEFKKTTWYTRDPCGVIIFTLANRMRPEQQRLMKKGWGWIIHISDFVEKENGCFIVYNQEGIVVRDARCITYPGMSGDPWWNHKQLLTQVNNMISIFDKAYPGCIALFVFDQSSAHASLRPDALHAFDMNKGNGGKQRKQKDTIIPMSNPHPEFCGKPQKITTEASEAKGL